MKQVLSITAQIGHIRHWFRIAVMKLVNTKTFALSQSKKSGRLFLAG
jgi:hypothetical protein